MKWEILHVRLLAQDLVIAEVFVLAVTVNMQFGCPRK